MAFQFRRAITIDAAVVDANLTDFPVRVALTSSNFNFGYVKADGSDIRFRASNGSTELDYEMEWFDAAGQTATFWVRVPTVDAATNTTIYIYYGDPTAADGQAAPGAVWDANFIGVWHFNESPQSSVGAPQLTDRTAGGANAETIGMIASDRIDSGRVGPAWQFAATPKYGVLPIDKATVRNLTQYTVHATVKTDSLDATQRRHVINEARGATSDVTRMSLSLETTHRFALMGRAGDADALTTYVSPTTTVVAGDWYHIVAVFDSVSDVHAMWLNGVETTLSVVAATVANTQQLSNTKIGTRVTAVNEFWDGQIAELRISNTARSDAWAKAEYHDYNGTLHTVGAIQNLTGWTITVGRVTEADTAQEVRLPPPESGPAFTTRTHALRDDDLAALRGNDELGGGLSATVGMVTETDTVRAVTARKTVTVGRVTEADTVRAVTARKTATAGQVSEVDTARSVAVAPQRRLVAVVTETDAARPVTARKTATVGQVTETDTARDISRRKTAAVGRVTETDTATVLVRRKTRAVGQVAEVDTAKAMRGPITVDRVTETDTVGAVTSRKTVTVGRVTEADTAHPMTRSVKTKTVGLIVETDTVRAVTAVKRVTIGLVTETDTVRAVTWRATRLTGRVTEADTARPISRTKTKTIGLVTETDSARDINRRGVAAKVTEVDTARPITARRTITVNRVTEADTARPLTMTKGAAVNRVTETDTARAITSRKQMVVTQVVETDTVRVVSATRVRPVNRVTETDLARPMGSPVKTRTVGMVTEVDTARLVAWNPQRRFVARVVETDLAQTVAYQSPQMPQRIHAGGREPPTVAAGRRPSTAVVAGRRPTGVVSGREDITP